MTPTILTGETGEYLFQHSATALLTTPHKREPTTPPEQLHAPHLANTVSIAQNTNSSARLTAASGNIVNPNIPGIHKMPITGTMKISHRVAPETFSSQRSSFDAYHIINHSQYRMRVQRYPSLGYITFSIHKLFLFCMSWIERFERVDSQVRVQIRRIHRFRGSGHPVI
jgi:hypothetical protein